MVITMAKLRMAHASKHGARKQAWRTQAAWANLRCCAHIKVTQKLLQSDPSFNPRTLHKIRVPTKRFSSSFQHPNTLTKVIVFCPVEQKLPEKTIFFSLVIFQSKFCQESIRNSICNQFVELVNLNFC